MFRSLAIVILFSLTGFIWTIFGQQTLAEKWDPSVLDLMRLDRRDEAYAALVKRAKYPPRAGYKEDKAYAVKDVLLCPQAKGLPLLAVFLRHDDDPRDSAKTRNGHFIYIAADGTIIPVYSGANSLHDNGRIEDLNGDGILECIADWLIGFDDFTVSGLHVTPVTRGQSPSLEILYKQGLKWHTIANDDGTQHIELSDGDIVVAEYSWSKEIGKWEGPDGGVGEAFVRVTGQEKDAAKVLKESLDERNKTK